MAFRNAWKVKHHRCSAYIIIEQNRNSISLRRTIVYLVFSYLFLYFSLHGFFPCCIVQCFPDSQDVLCLVSYGPLHGMYSCAAHLGYQGSSRASDLGWVFFFLGKQNYIKWSTKGTFYFLCWLLLMTWVVCCWLIPWGLVCEAVRRGTRFLLFFLFYFSALFCFPFVQKKISKTYLFMK